MYHQIISKYRVCFLLLIFLFQSCTTTYYVVRHAEKSSVPANDPLLTQEGQKRAENLKEILLDKKIEHIYSSKTERTMATARPLAVQMGKEIKIYNPSDQADFIEQLKKSKKNTLVVGHSNTIRHIINGLAERSILAKDLEDHEYDNIFLIRRKGIGKPRYENIKF